MLASGIVLGFALGGMFDAIVIHLILQWHHVASAVIEPTTVEGLRRNLVVDGLFFAAMWLLTVAGLWLLWQAQRRARPLPGRVLAGSLLLGWGTFNLFDSLVTHSLLQLHHVRPDQALLGDLAFVLSGAVLLAVGWWLLLLGNVRPRPPDR